MEGDKKITNMKEDTQGYLIIAVLWLLIGLITATIITSISDTEKAYEWAKNGQIGHSSNCYLVDSVGYCIVDGEKIRVDNYYEVKE